MAVIKRIGSNVLLLGLVSLLVDMSSEMILPILPLFIVSIGGTAVIVGLIGGVSDSLSSILKFFSGYFSDKFRKRIPFVVSGYTLSAISKVILYFALSWPAVLVSKILDRFGKGVRSAPRDAFIAETTDKSIRGRAFGLHRTMDTLGAVIGSIFVLILFWLLGFNFQTIFLIAAVIAFIAIIPFKFIRENKRKADSELHTQKKEIKLGLHLKQLPRGFKLFLVVAGVFALGNFTYMFFILRAQTLLHLDFIDSVGFVLLLYIWFNIVYTLLSYPSGVLSDKFGRENTLIIGYAVFAITCLGFAFITNSTLPSMIVFAILFALYGLFNALIEGNQRAFASDFVSPEREGTALGAFHTVIGLATLPASVVAGFLWEIINPSFLFIYGAGMAILAIILFLFFVKSDRKK